MGAKDLTRIKDLAGLAPELREVLASDEGGGVLVGLTATVAYTDTTAKNLFVVPNGAIIVGIDVNVSTAFNSSGTDLLDIGKTGTANHFKNDLDVSAAGQTVTGWSNLGAVAADTQITATYVQSVADAAAGAARITFTCLIPV